MKRKFLLSMLFVLALATTLSSFLLTRARSQEADLNARLERHAHALQAQLQRRDQLKQILSTLSPNDATKSALLKLRAEVADLRRSTTNLHALRTALTNLQNEIQTAQNSPPTNSSAPPHPSKIRATWPKDQLTFAGYADETSALQSTLWAMSRGDLSAILSALAPGNVQNVNDPTAFARLWRDSSPNPSQADKDGTSPKAIKARDSNLQRLAASLRPVTAFHLVSDDISPRLDHNPELKIYKIHFQGDGATRGLGFKKVGDELKFVSVYAIGGTDEHPTYESNLWP
jgi:hypothetical protein